MSYAGFNVIDWLLPINEWTRPGTKITPKGLAIHWTGNISKGSKAWNNANFFHNRRGSYGSAPYIIDEADLYRVIPENEMAYHVGATTYKTTRFGSYPNNQLIGLEICVHMDADWEKVYDHAVRFAAAICLKYKWMDPWAVLVRHYDITGKDCPLMWTSFVHNDAHVRSSVISMLFPKRQGETNEEHAARIRANESKIQDGIKWVRSLKAGDALGDDGWNQFIQHVADAMNGVYKKAPAPAPKPEPTPAPEPPKTIEEKVVYFMGKYFADVDDSSWKAGGINKLHELKTADGNPILAGSTDESGKKVARPDAPITRAEAALLIERGIRYAIEQAKR